MGYVMNCGLVTHLLPDLYFGYLMVNLKNEIDKRKFLRSY